MVIHQLQYLRAIAALSVVLCHASYYVQFYRGDGRMWEIFSRAGGFGVVLFFAISGYLMAHLSQTTSGLRFMGHRLIRIYPIYWLCLFSVITIRLLFGAPVSLDPLSLLLAPGGTTSYVLGIEWTLPFELTFYIIVFMVMMFGLQRQLPRFAAAWILMIELVLAVRPDFQQGQFPLLLNLPLSQYSLAFAGGLLIPFAIRQRWIGPATLLFALGLLAASEAMPNAALSFGMMCLGCVLLVAVAVRPRNDEIRTPNATLTALGDWSYALYLCHVPIIMALCSALPKSVPTMQLWFAAAGLPIIAAIGIGKLDIALYRILKRWIDRSSNLVRAALSIIFFAAMLGTAGYTYIRVIEARKASVEPTALAAKLTSFMTDNQANLNNATLAIGLLPDDRLHGYFDEVSHRVPGQVLVQGWAADASGGGRSVQVLIFRCGHYLGAMLPQDRRPDVGEALHIKSGRYGFSTILTDAESCGLPKLDGVLVTRDGRYSLMTTSVRE